MEYQLKYPIKSEEGKERLVLKMKDRIKGADLLVLDEPAGDVERSLKFIAKMCSISRYESEQLDAVDIEALNEMLVKKRAE